MMFRGALPGRKPLIFELLDTFLKAFSYSLVTTSASMTTLNSTRTGLIFSTLTCMISPFGEGVNGTRSIPGQEASRTSSAVVSFVLRPARPQNDDPHERQLAGVGGLHRGRDPQQSKVDR